MDGSHGRWHLAAGRNRAGAGDWGIKVPVEGAAGKVIYVWFEAVLGYISSAKELSQQRNQPDLWKKYWLDPKTKYIAFIGKDNIVFHTIIFPAILMAWNEAGKEQYCLPQNVPANEFLNFEGKKFSKSRNWGIDVDEFLTLFPADLLRYALAANLPENRDTDFYWKEFQLRNNSELADIFGNLINRTFTFVHKHFDGKVPPRNKIEMIDNEMIELAGVWPGAKLICGEQAREGDPEFGVSRGRLLPSHTPVKVGATLQESLGLVHGGMAQNVGPILEMVTEKYLLRSEGEWAARREAMAVLEEVVDALQAGDLRRIAVATTRNFSGQTQTIIPWATNKYTETLIDRVRQRFGDAFWGFWMLGGMSGGGMGFIFAPERRAEAQTALQEIMSGTKRVLQDALPFAMEPVV